MVALTRVRARWAAVAAIVAVGAAGCGASSTFTTTATALPTGTPSAAPTAAATAHGATAKPAATPHASLLAAPTYGTDGSLVVVTIAGATANSSVSVALCSLKTPTAKVATIVSSCDPDALTVNTDAAGGAVANYTIAEVPAASTHGYAIVLRGLGGAVLGETGFNPDLPATPSPRPTTTPVR